MLYISSDRQEMSQTGDDSIFAHEEQSGRPNQAWSFMYSNSMHTTTGTT